MNQVLHRGTRTTIALALLVAIAGEAPAHGGGLNADGCHTNRKTGEYHCHRPQSSARPASGIPLRSDLNSDSTSRSRTTYANCSEVRAAGKAPLRRGEPGYADHLDRDGDGIACEPYRR